MARGISFAFLIVAAVAACVGEDPDVPATTPGPDGGSSSSGGLVGNLIVDGSFENGCAAISTNGGRPPESDSTPKLAHTGGKTCKVCRMPGAEPSLYIYAVVDDAPKVNAVYEVSAWVRKVPGVESGGNSQMTIIGLDPGDAVNGDGQAVDGPETISDVWQEARLTWTVTKDAAQARVDLGIPQAPDNICFLVDDLYVKRK